MTSLPHALVMASAGTGKTRALTLRYLRLLLTGVESSRVLALTFTRKAAAEIFSRIVERLHEAALSEAHAATLARDLGMPVTRRACIGALTGLLRGTHTAPIGTIDSFVVRLAEMIDERGVIPESWRIADDDEDQALRARALSRTIASADRRELLTLLRAMREGRFSAGVRQALMRTLDATHGVFVGTPREAWEMAGRLAHEGALDGPAYEHALANLARVPLARARSGEVHGSWASAHAASLGALHRQDWCDFLGRGLAQKISAGEATFHRLTISDDVRDAYAPLIRHAEAMVLRGQARVLDSTHRLLAAFDGNYRALQFEAGILRLDDLTRGVLSSTQETRDAAYFRVDARVDHVLLDEFQDTSIAQFGVLRPIAHELISGGMGAGDQPAGRSVFVVGDAKQSLYQWREAEPALMGQLPRVWPGAFERSTLATSFRSSGVVLELVNRVFGRLADHPALEKHAGAAREWCGSFESHRAGRELEGHARWSVVARRETGPASRRALLERAADIAADLAGAHPTSSVALLVRSRGPISRLVRMLGTRGVPASEEGGNPLTDSRAVVLVLSLLRAVDHPGDRAARFHVGTSPLAQDLELEAWDDDVESRRVLSRLREAIAERGIAASVERVSGLLTPHCDGADRRRLAQLADMAERFEARDDPRLSSFIDLVRRQRVDRPGGERVRVMTIHAAKGLEFDAVVLLDLDSPMAGRSPALLTPRRGPLEEVSLVIPSANEETRKAVPLMREAFEAWRERKVQEELCVLYVGMTRAKHAVDIVTLDPRVPGVLTQARVVRGALRPDTLERDPGDAESRGPTGVLFEVGNPHWQPRPSGATEATTHMMHGPAVQPAAHHAGSSPSPAPAAMRPRFEFRESPRAPSASPPPSAGHAAHHLGAALSLDTSAVDRGTVLHAWFESIEWLDEHLPNDARLVGVARALGMPAGSELDRAIATFGSALSAESVRDVFSRESARRRLAVSPASALEVHRELPFDVNVDGSRLPGRIDRLVIARDSARVIAAEVVDFKSDAFPSSIGAHVDAVSLGAALERHRVQMEAYRLATARLTGLEPRSVAVRVVFVSIGRVVEVAGGEAP